MIIDRFYKFLLEEGPQKKGDCTLFEDKDGHYYLVIGQKDMKGQMVFVINDRFWYDYAKKWSDTGEKWTKIYEKIK